MESAVYYKSAILKKYLGESVDECYPSNDTTTGIPIPIPTSILVPGEAYLYGLEWGDNYFTGDDVLLGTIQISIGFPARNRFFSNLNIGSNGLISFSVLRNFNPSAPFEFWKVAGINFIAPFWTDIVAQDPHSRIFYHVYDVNNIRLRDQLIYSVLQTASRDVHYFYEDTTFRAQWALVVTWENVSPSRFSAEEEEMTFQCVLVTDGYSSYVIFKYISMSWLFVRGRKAAVGYRLFDYKENDLSFDDAVFSIKEYKGNVGLRGYYIYKLTDDNSKEVNYKQLCYNWYSKYRDSTTTANSVIWNQRYNCPCSLKSIAFDWRWLKVQTPIGGVICFSLFARKVLPSTRTCCYNQFFGTYIRIEPSAGTFNLYHPIFDPRRYIKEEALPKQYCCYKTNLCRLFYSVRPIGTCYGRPPFAFRWFWGDPHIETLDGYQYTFNGLGEYWLMRSENENGTFELQARTDLIMNENGTFSNATIFSAFAARDNDTTFQVELSSDRKQLIVFANGKDYTTQYNGNQDFSMFDERIIMSRHNDTLVVVFGNSGLQLNVTLGIRMLTFSTTVPNEFGGQTSGLVGNFDGNKDNDFILPNGTALGTNDTNTERKIFFNFGIHWAVNSTTSIFSYTKGKSADDYAYPDFIPVFIDEFPEDEVNKSKEICGGKSASTACIFDYLLTKDESVGRASGTVDEVALETVKASDNRIPSISGTQHVNATIGSPVEIHVNASDDGNFTYRVLTGPDTDFDFIAQDSKFVWTPTDITPINISITAVDDSGLAAPPLDVYVVVCSNCSGHGICLYSQTRATSTILYAYALCGCDAGWTGDHCDSEIDGCAGLPCAENRNCTDLTPKEEAQFGRAYNCSPCPLGYTENGQKCLDINECNNTNMCHHTCQNSVGSYTCDCHNGYRLLDDSLCYDINECTEGTHDCEQKCKNTDGNFTCSCVYGFELQKDGTSCTQVLDVCGINGLSCEYACDNNTADGRYGCICPTGQKIKSDGSTCEDLDECLLNICPQQCNNTDGSFICSCFNGFKLESDKINCRPCKKRSWGPNCANECQCGIGEDRCDAARGCICLSGYGGERCDEDINECIVDPGICSINATCSNNFGSYICTCLPGYEKNDDGNCENTNECASEILHNCTISVSDCDDNIGSFTCKCKEGYNKLNPYQCVDINECTAGSHSCEQLCNNVDGSYNCDCELGFRLKNDRRGCEKDFEPCTNLTCSYGCKIENGTAFCFCKDGYKVDDYGTICIDIDECSIDMLNTCSYKNGCANTNGSYTCTCLVGYFLENDDRTCSDCDIFHWGPDCLTLCNCGRGTSYCDNIDGCQCLAGWYGTTCALDINECDDDPCSGQNEDCFNTLGSYFCRCMSGYRNQSGICENIDECDENTHTCDQTCTDTDGSYNCSCNAGFMLLNNGKCEDINECQTGENKCKQKCDNTLGSYRCSCNEGFTLDNTNRYQCHGSSSESSSLNPTVDPDMTTSMILSSTVFPMDRSDSVSTYDMVKSSMPDFSSTTTLSSFQTEENSTTLSSSLDDKIYSTSTKLLVTTTSVLPFSATLALKTTSDQGSSLEVSSLSSKVDVTTGSILISTIPAVDMQSSVSTSFYDMVQSSTQDVSSSTTIQTEKVSTTLASSFHEIIYSTSTKLLDTSTSVLPFTDTYAMTTTSDQAESTTLRSEPSIGPDPFNSFSTYTGMLEPSSLAISPTQKMASSSEKPTSLEIFGASSSVAVLSSQIMTTTTPMQAEEKVIIYSFEYKLNIFVIDSLTDQRSKEYNETFNKVHTSLTTFYLQQFGGSFKEVTLKSIRKGSLIAEHDLILKEEQQDIVVQVIRDLLTDKVQLTYENQQTSVTSVSYTDGDTKKTATTENITQAVCEIYVSLKPCQDKYICQLIDGVPICRASPTQDNSSMMAVITSVSVVVAILLMVIVTLIVIMYRKNKLKTEKPFASGKQIPKKLTRHWPRSADNRSYVGDDFEGDTYPYSTSLSGGNSVDQGKHAYSNFGGDLFHHWQDWFPSENLTDFKIKRPHIDLAPGPKPDY